MLEHDACHMGCERDSCNCQTNLRKSILNYFHNFNIMNLLTLLLAVSEKAANIARVCRQNENLFELLIQEKSSAEANVRFLKDFKTLADVLIQETVRHDIKQHFPVLEQQIYGEENNRFTNTLGETIEVKVCASEEETSKLLDLILDGNSTAASILANEVHKTVELPNLNVYNDDIPSEIGVDIENICIWIDPIDSTAEYINAKESKHETSIYLSGLQCVTVLIGAYDKRTGIPLIGIINQPFFEQIDAEWKGKCYWGCTSNNNKYSSLSPCNQESNIITLSKIELDSIKSKLLESGYSLVEASGAGYKLLSVINGLADAYIVSQGTTFLWDVCGPHAILRALGGGVYNYTQSLQGKCVEINYINDISASSKINKHCNHEGILAVKNEKIFETLKQLLSK